MPTSPVESTHDQARQSSTESNRATAGAEPNHPVPEKGAPGVESPSAEQMQGANGLPREANSDDTEPGAGDQDIDTAGTEADELSLSRSAMGFPRSDNGSPAKVL